VRRQAAETSAVGARRVKELSRRTRHFPRAKPGGVAMSPLRVLIVEDEPMVSLLLQDILRDLGHTITGVAPSLRTAVAIAAGAPSDLAIIDVGLVGDGGDGVDTAVALRRRFGVPSLLMTGASFAHVGDRVKDAQPVGFLQKPCGFADVERALTAAIAHLNAAP
jgi:CheY-like chemotaxis protein